MVAGCRTDDIESTPFWVVRVVGSNDGVSDGRRRNISITGRLVGSEVGRTEEEGRTGGTASGPTDGRECVDREG